MRVLVIEDSPEVMETVTLCIKLRWPEAEVLSAGDGEQGLKLAVAETTDLVVLDIGLPGMGGMEVLQALRRHSDVAVMMLTARDGATNIARFLEAGADDYVTKPFSHLEFLGRAQALIRRAQARGGQSQCLQAGDLVADFESDAVYLAGKPLKLTRTELSILRQLMAFAPGSVTFEALSLGALQVVVPTESDAKSLRVHIGHLRSKLGESADSPKYIANVYGVGYKFLLVPSRVASSVHSFLKPSLGEPT